MRSTRKPWENDEIVGYDCPLKEIMSVSILRTEYRGTKGKGDELMVKKCQKLKIQSTLVRFNLLSHGEFEISYIQQPR